MSQKRDLKKYLLDYPKEIILKDGTGVSMKPLNPGDEDALFKMFKRLSEDDRWFLNQDVSDPHLIKSWINHLEMERMISIIAVVEGRIIGNAALMLKDYGAKSHIGKVRISVDPGYRERRLATWMLLDLINLAISMGLQMIVMRLVRDRDHSVMRAVKKLDFIEEAVLEDYILDKDGNSHDLLIMVKRLSLDC